MFAIIQIGIENGEQNHDQCDNEEQPEIAEESSAHNQQTANGPNPAGETMGSIPVALVCQSLGDLDADGIVLFAFGHVIADDQEQTAQYQG